MRVTVVCDNRFIDFCGTKLPYSRNCVMNVYNREITISIDGNTYYFCFDSIEETKRMRDKFNTDYLKVSDGKK